jgi:DNA invertase Pin-like site-specific DNA recombinase
MTGRLLPMSKIEEIKRLIALNLSERAIARAIRCSRKTVRKYLSEIAVEESESSHWGHLINWESILWRSHKFPSVAHLNSPTL